MVLSLILVGCSSGAKPQETKTQDDKIVLIQTDINNLRVADTDVLAKIDKAQKDVEAAVKMLDESKIKLNQQSIDLDSQMKSIQESINTIQNQLKVTEFTNSQLTLVRADLEKINSQMAGMNSDILNLKRSIQLTPIPTALVDDLKITVTKPTEYLESIQANQEYAVNFIVTMYNPTAAVINHIIINGHIVSDHGISFDTGYSVMLDTVIPPVIYDLVGYGSGFVDWQFWRSTGSPTTAYINPGDTFIFHPQLKFKSTNTINTQCQFTLTISGTTWEGK